jgi:hypothetical protein
MIKKAPMIFDKAYESAKDEWDTLEKRPSLAAPWKQLFEQVKSPRHVLSELLQNAEDANATEVTAYIKDDIFYFIHNGDDFTSENLYSLCRFAFSNKRHLHTIGFRGIGFKSIFSLGPKVEIKTPTLSFAFDEKRFTEPIWLGDEFAIGETEIKIKIKDKNRLKALMEDFQKWVHSPIPLLFFKNIKCLNIEDDQIHKEIIKEGPIPNSEYVKLTNHEERGVLVISSDPEDFPEECLAEIKEIRGSVELNLPPCIVQIVYEDTDVHRLYTVLPTDVKVELPFSVNAPFIQDPSRKAIIEPEISKTNRWLLKRIGRLAGLSMHTWLGNEQLNIKERAKAYNIMIDELLRIREGGYKSDLDNICSDEIKKEFNKYLKDNTGVLLSSDGTLVDGNNIVCFDQAILKTWDEKEALSIFEKERQFILSEQIDENNIQKLKNRKLVKIIERDDIANVLTKVRPPKPNQIEKLVHLWDYVYPYCSHWVWKDEVKNMGIVPVVGEDLLYDPKEALVLGGKAIPFTKEEDEFLKKWAYIVSPKWVNIISNTENERTYDSILNNSIALFNWLGFNNKIGIEQVVAKASFNLFRNDDPGEDGIKLSQLAAKYDVRVPDTFKYRCIDGQWRIPEGNLLHPYYESLDEYLTENIYKSHVIDNEYEQNMEIELAKKWRSWACNLSKSKLTGFLSPEEKIRTCGLLKV